MRNAATHHPHSFTIHLPNETCCAVWQIVEELDLVLSSFALPGSTIEEHQGFRRSGSLAAGRAGIATYFAYRDLIRPSSGAKEISLSLLQQAIDAVAALPASLGLFDGFTGVAWAVHHLNAIAAEEIADEETCVEVDNYLVQWLQTSPSNCQPDLISGLVGIGLYALSRWPRESAKTCLDLVVHHLDETAVYEEAGITWRFSIEETWAPMRDWSSTYYYNLGVAHGVGGIIGLLGQATAAGIGSAAQLLAGSTAWLLQQQMPDGESSRFPGFIEPSIAPTPSIPGWCYGELGLAGSLFLAGRCTTDSKLSEVALDIARRAAKRPLDARTAIRDPAVCHGTGGMAHMFNRFYRCTGEEVFADAARLWLDRVIRIREKGQGLAGYRFFRHSGGETRLESDPGFLLGASGVGLALLGLVSDIDTSWDSVLLLSPANVGLTCK